MLTKRSIAALAAAAAISAIPIGGQAATYDINADFSLLANPAGVWSYGYIDTGGFHFYDQPDGVDNAWRSSVVQSLEAPVDFNNTTDGVVNRLLPHTAGFHPGPGGEFSVYRFTAPTTGSYRLSALFGAADTGGTDVHVLKNGTSIFDHEIDPSVNPSVPFDTILGLTAGEIVDFTVGWGVNANFFSDSTSINATLTALAPVAVPEPETYALMMAGLGLLGFVARRRKALAGRGAESGVTFQRRT